MGRIKQFSFLLISLISFSCADLSEPEFKKLDSLKVHSIENGNVNIRAEAIFFNPNSRRLILRSAHIDVFMKNKKSATIDQDYAMPIPPNQEFAIPFEAVLPLLSGDSGLLANALNLLGGRDEEVTFRGHINVTVNRIPFRVLIDHKETINIKLF